MVLIAKRVRSERQLGKVGPKKGKTHTKGFKDETHGYFPRRHFKFLNGLVDNCADVHEFNFPQFLYFIVLLRAMIKN